MSSKKIIQFSICFILATVLALTAHIYISAWSQPITNLMMQGFQVPTASSYSSAIVAAAYATGFITVGLLVFLWYHTQHILPINSSLLRILLVAAILLELKGNLIRQPIMDILVSYSIGMQGLKPFLFVGLNSIDQWVSALIKATCLVYLCPKKYHSAYQ